MLYFLSFIHFPCIQFIHYYFFFFLFLISNYIYNDKFVFINSGRDQFLIIMNGTFLRLIERIIKELVWVYKYAVDYYEEYGSGNTNMVEIKAKSQGQGLQAYEIY